MATFFNQATLTYNNTTTLSNVVTGEIVGVITAEKTAVSPNYTAGGDVTYVISTRDVNSLGEASDGFKMRRAAVENNVTMFTALDTVKVLLDVLEEITLSISTIDA